MKREEAIKLLKQYQGYEPMFQDGETLKHAFDLTDETVDTLLTALRPVSREQVEKVWRGEWMFPIFGDQQDENDPRCQCSECGSIETPLARHRFCPSCGAPMTDEAVDMMLERWKEALGDEN